MVRKKRKFTDRQRERAAVSYYEDKKCMDNTQKNHSLKLYGHSNLSLHMETYLVLNLFNLERDRQCERKRKKECSRERGEEREREIERNWEWVGGD